jgi:hypothetical protein
MMDGTSAEPVPDLPVLIPILNNDTEYAVSSAEVVVQSGEASERKDSTDSGAGDLVLESGKKNRRRSSDASKVKKTVRRKGKKTGKRSMAAKKNDPDEDDDATEIEDNDDDEEEFEWPVTRPDRPRPLPPVSQGHADLLQRFRDRKIITEQEVYDIMMKVDFGLFYENVKDEWVEHNAVIIERTMSCLKPGFRILLSPLNVYYAVVLALLVGDEGGVVAFGHYGNVHTLTKAGLKWMIDDYRLRFTNNRYELFYGKPNYEQFLTNGFPKGAPYDMIVMTDQPLSDAVMNQLKPNGIIIRPDIEDYILHPSHLIPHQPEDTAQAEPDQ